MINPYKAHSNLDAATPTVLGWSKKTSTIIWAVAMICQIAFFVVPAYSLYRNIARDTETTIADPSGVSVDDTGFILAALLFNFGTVVAMLSQVFCKDLSRPQKWLRTVGTFVLGLCITAIFVWLMFALAMPSPQD